MSNMIMANPIQARNGRSILILGPNSLYENSKCDTVNNYSKVFQSSGYKRLGGDISSPLIWWDTYREKVLSLSMLGPQPSTKSRSGHRQAKHTSRSSPRPPTKKNIPRHSCIFILGY